MESIHRSQEDIEGGHFKLTAMEWPVLLTTVKGNLTVLSAADNLCIIITLNILVGIMYYIFVSAASKDKLHTYSATNLKRELLFFWYVSAIFSVCGKRMVTLSLQPMHTAWTNHYGKLNIQTQHNYEQGEGSYKCPPSIWE